MRHYFFGAGGAFNKMLKKRGEGEKREKREEEEKERGEERKEEKRGQLMNKMAFYACLSLSFLCFLF